MAIITELQIEGYIKEVKILPKGFNPSLRQKGDRNCFEQEIKCTSGNIYKIIVRQNMRNLLDFSVIFGVFNNGKLFRIKRYNGFSHRHTNKIENIQVTGFHIHKATERYQLRGFKEDGYAEETKAYTDWKTALNTMIIENSFIHYGEEDQRKL